MCYWGKATLFSMMLYLLLFGVNMLDALISTMHLEGTNLRKQTPAILL